MTDGLRQNLYDMLDSAGSSSSSSWDEVHTEVDDMREAQATE